MGDARSDRTAIRIVNATVDSALLVDGAAAGRYPRRKAPRTAPDRDRVSAPKSGGPARSLNRTGFRGESGRYPHDKGAASAIGPSFQGPMPVGAMGPVSPSGRATAPNNPHSGSAGKPIETMESAK